MEDDFAAEVQRLVRFSVLFAVRLGLGGGIEVLDVSVTLGFAIEAATCRSHSKRVVQCKLGGRRT